MHLGMSGKFTVFDTAGRPPLSRVLAQQNAAPGPDLQQQTKTGNPHDHIVFHLDNGFTVVYNDPRRFGYMTLIAEPQLAAHKFFQDLGIEPLQGALTAQYLARTASGKAVSLKAFLMDQRIIAGLGNIYVCEALFRAHLSPRRKAASLATASGQPTARAKRLAPAIREVLQEAIKAGGSSLRDYQHADGSLGYFQHAFRVYDREGAACKTVGCEGRIRRIVQNGRSTFYCPACQR